MKVYMNGYPDTWLSPYTIIDYVFFWTDWSKCSRNKQIIADEKWIDHPAWVEKVVPLLNPFCEVLKKVREVISPTIRYVKIDRYDTWSMDHTLAYIIHPMLVQLNETKHGAPYTDDEDVPEYLRSHMAQPKENEWDTDSLHFMRWDWILNEMIWAFEQELKDDDEHQFFDHSECGDEKPWDKDGKYVSKLKLDTEGLEKHQKRKANGFRLFGRYYQNLWD
jgi:hypothetical protein